jgi:serine/threonine-protein kinase
LILTAIKQKKTAISNDSFMTHSAAQPSDPSPHQESSVDLTGQTFGDYILIRRLGRGGMADVYLAEQESLHRQVAFKVLRQDFARDETYVRRFVNEARAAAALVQANIVQIYEVGQIEGVHFIAQEYVRGQNLRQYINRFGATEPIMAVNIIRQVGMALQKSSEQGIIHRDIKPENIMLAPNGEVKVADFGLARIDNQNQKSDLTQIGVTMGTPLYMSPEQIEGNSVDSRSDIYSLGVTSYHMLAGHPPFDGETALAIAVQHVKNNPDPIAELRPDVPQELSAIIMKMIAKDPAERFQSATEMLKELRKVHIDYDDWDQLVENLAEPHSVAKSERRTLSQSRLAVTHQLQTVMKGHLQPFWKTAKFWLAGILLVLIGSGASAWYAVANPPAGLFDRDFSALGTIEKKMSAREQYRLAVKLNSVSGYEAVAEYFPPESPQNRVYVWYSWERLGELLLRRDERDSAMKIYEKLAALPATEIRFRLVGLLGKSEVYSRREQKEEVRQLETEIRELKNNLGEAEASSIESNFRDAALPPT